MAGRVWVRLRGGIGVNYAIVTAVRSDAQQPMQFKLEGLHWVRVGTMTDEGRRRTAIWRVMPLH